jgi:transposase-like protein
MKGAGRERPRSGLLPGSNEERELLSRALLRAGASVTVAARELGVSRVTVYRMMARNHLAVEWVIRHDPPIDRISDAPVEQAS